MLPLTCHPGTPADAITGFAASAERGTDGELRFRYMVRGDIKRIALSAKASARQTDELWRHTCFEAFITTEDERAYVECNFAPSTAWATYRFDRYRTRMTTIVPVEPPHITLQIQESVPRTGSSVILEVRLRLNEFAGQPLRIGLSAVIESKVGDLSYWALRHPRSKPDFHHRGGFILRIAA